MTDRVRILNDRITIADGLSISFQRTLRIPDDGRDYPLPPGLGNFPIRRVDDFRDRVPAEWLEHGGVFLPMYQREAMWICFHGQYWKPRAVKVGVGKVCAITGNPWREAMHHDPQDYIVTPPQPWLDGICVGRGAIRQFVAMPLGMGYTVEGQVTGHETVGGIQLKVIEPRAGRFPDAPVDEMVMCQRLTSTGFGAPAPKAMSGAIAPGRARSGAMGIAAGGRMKQSVYSDPHRIDSWDEANASRVFVHIVNSELWREITGEAAPATPVTAREYAAHNLPWFDLYDESLAAVSAASILSNVHSVKALDAKKSNVPLQDDEPVDVGPVKKFLTTVAKNLGVRDGKW